MLALDAYTISYFFRGDPQVMDRLLATAPALLAVPSVVVYELRYGLLRLPAAAARSRLDALGKFLQPLRVLDFDEPGAQAAAALRASLESQGTMIGPHDLLIAATALRHGASRVTRNVREFSRVPGLQVVNGHAAPQG